MVNIIFRCFRTTDCQRHRNSALPRSAVFQSAHDFASDTQRRSDSRPQQETGRRGKCTASTDGYERRAFNYNGDTCSHCDNNPTQYACHLRRQR